jgi:hypothetical protein
MVRIYAMAQAKSVTEKAQACYDDRRLADNIGCKKPKAVAITMPT